MKTVYHLPVGSYTFPPKRGDIIQSNIGNRRERTWLILAVRRAPTRFCSEMGCTADRFRIWAERWWEIEPETRVRLFRSAERACGQLCWGFALFKPKSKKKRNFEALMREGLHERV